MNDRSDTFNQRLSINNFKSFTNLFQISEILLNIFYLIILKVYRLCSTLKNILCIHQIYLFVNLFINNQKNIAFRSRKKKNANKIAHLTSKPSTTNMTPRKEVKTIMTEATKFPRIIQY